MRINDRELIKTVWADSWEIYLTSDSNVYVGQPRDECVAWCGVARKVDDASLLAMAFNKGKGGIQ